MMQIALTLNGIKFEKHKPIIGQPDIFIEPNICLFIDGDYWHANPNKYSSEVSITKDKKAKNIWARDIQVNNELSKMGYLIVRLWESDIKKNTQGCAEKVIEALRNQLEMQRKFV
jgi:DNA mismatch endonuclease (patch repair protein)